MSTEFIPLHRQLVHFLSQYEVFKLDDGQEEQPLFKMRKKYLYVGSGEEFTVAQLNGAAELLAVLFNLVGPTSLGFDLRKLLKAYFLDEEKRKEIHKLL